MKRALVLLADGTEELEVVTVIDLLRRARVHVVVAGLHDGPVTASRGVRLMAECEIDSQQLDTFDALILPGGAGGTRCFEEDERVLDLIRQASARPMILAAICAAPRALHRANVLRGKRVTSYPGALHPHDPSYTYVEESVVEDGWLVTSRGPGTAMDFALTLVARLCGAEVRDEVEGPLMRPFTPRV